MSTLCTIARYKGFHLYRHTLTDEIFLEITDGHRERIINLSAKLGRKEICGLLDAIVTSMIQDHPERTLHFPKQRADESDHRYKTRRTAYLKKLRKLGVLKWR